MKKGQAEILGTVLVSAIVLVIVGSAFVWGKPLIDKSSDKSKLDTLLLKFDELDSSIKHVASTGSSKLLRINLHENDQLEIKSNGEILLQTHMKVPLITSKDWAPLNAYELPEEKELYYITMNEDPLDTTTYPNFNVSLMSPGSDIYNASLGKGDWNVLVYRRQTTPYTYLCVATGSNFTDEKSQCGIRGEDIFTDGGNYTIIRINESGSPVYISGGYIENMGLLARDVPGIIMGKSKMLGEREGLLTEIKMKYRGLIDDKNTAHRIVISCQSNCVSSSGVKELRILRTDVQRNPDSIDTYINIEFV